MRRALPLVLVALLSCTDAPKRLGGTQPHGPMLASAGNWVPSEAAISAVLAGFPRSPFAGGGVSLGASNVFTGPVELSGTVSSYTVQNNGVTIGQATFPGIWLLGTGNTPSSSNYAIMDAGPLLLNDAAQVIMRVANANQFGCDGSTCTFYKPATYPTGAAGIAGRATLVAGTVTVSTTAVTASSVIQLTNCVTGGTAGLLRVGTVTAGTSFVINSASGTDTSTICWSFVN